MTTETQVPVCSRRSGSSRNGGLRCLLNLSVADARGAHAQPLCGATHQSAHALKVHIPTAVGEIMGVTHAVAETRPFAAHFTNSRHDEGSPRAAARITRIPRRSAARKRRGQPRCGNAERGDTGCGEIAAAGSSTDRRAAGRSCPSSDSLVAHQRMLLRGFLLLRRRA